MPDTSSYMGLGENPPSFPWQPHHRARGAQSAAAHPCIASFVSEDFSKRLPCVAVTTIALSVSLLFKEKVEFWLRLTGEISSRWYVPALSFATARALQRYAFVCQEAQSLVNKSPCHARQHHAIHS